MAIGFINTEVTGDFNPSHLVESMGDEQSDMRENR